MAPLAVGLGVSGIDEWWKQGVTLSPGLPDNLGALLSQPVIAVVLGVASGIGLLLLSRRSFALISADDAGRGIVLASMALAGRLFAATILLWTYSHFAPSGYLAYGLTFAGSFLLVYMIELVRFAGLHRYARPVAGSRDGR